MRGDTLLLRGAELATVLADNRAVLAAARVLDEGERLGQLLLTSSFARA